MLEQRQYLRLQSQVITEISHPSFGMIELKARDLSEGGVFVFFGNHIPPPVGTVVQARIKRHTGVINQVPVDMLVVRHQSGGMGLKFL
ncbi:MAG: hypothetical protein ACJAYG_001982 [Oceanicoccus sp.]|jgi:hypothetical protein